MLLSLCRANACAAALALGLAFCSCASANDATTASYALGDWNGLRSELADRGITFNLGYGSELAHNIRGGERELTRHSGQLALGMNADLERLWGWHDAEFQVSVSERDGRNLGADAGIDPLMPIQENYGRGQTWRLSELWFGQTFFADRLQVKLGRMGVGADFSLFGCDFMNITFCGGQPANTVYDYWQSWPISQWGALAKLRFAGDWSIGAGAYQINPYYSGRSHGFSIDPNGTIGTLFPLELAWKPVVAGLPGDYKLGGWYSSADRADVYTDIDGGAAGLSGLDFAMRSGSHGVYVMLMQQVTGDTVSKRGISLFLNLLQSDYATNPIDRAISAGATWRGIAAARPDDMLGIGYGTSSVNARTARYQRQLVARTGDDVDVQGETEQSAEIFYAIQVTPWLVMRPDLQWIHNAGARNQPDVHVVGLKSSISF
jgi:porin